MDYGIECDFQAALEGLFKVVNLKLDQLACVYVFLKLRLAEQAQARCESWVLRSLIFIDYDSVI